MVRRARLAGCRVTRVVKLESVGGDTVYIGDGIMVAPYEYGVSCHVAAAGFTTTVKGTPADVAARIWPDLDKPAAPVVSDEDVLLARNGAQAAIDGRPVFFTEGKAMLHILAALGR